MPNSLPDILLKSYIGFDNLFNEISRFDYIENSNFPPFDVIKIDKFNYQINLAVAGFNKEEVEITSFNNTLLIKGKRNKEFNHNILHKGLSFRPFQKKFNLNPLIEVIDAQLKNGILIINLLERKPKIKSPKNIEINII